MLQSFGPKGLNTTKYNHLGRGTARYNRIGQLLWHTWSTGVSILSTCVNTLGATTTPKRPLFLQGQVTWNVSGLQTILFAFSICFSKGERAPSSAWMPTGGSQALRMHQLSNSRLVHNLIWFCISYCSVDFIISHLIIFSAQQASFRATRRSLGLSLRNETSETVTAPR